LFTWPLGLIPYLPAYVLWCIGGLALYLLAAFAGGAHRRNLLLLTLTPAVALNVFYGQNGFLTAALLIGGLANLDRRPVAAGILFGILTIKPQIGLLVPVLLVVTGRWRVILAALATTAVLVTAASFWFGFDIWPEFFRKVMPQQHWLMIKAGELGWTMVSSTFVQARLVGLPINAAWALQGVSSFCALASVVWAYRRRRDPVLSQALFVTATFLFSPWMTSYDMVVFGWTVASLRERSDNTSTDHGLAIALWMLPAAMVAFGAARIPVAASVLAAFAGRLVWRLCRPESQRIVTGQPALALPPAA
jgi:alpha-1,2-mannosyltransferase